MIGKSMRTRVDAGNEIHQLSIGISEPLVFDKNSRAADIGNFLNGLTLLIRELAHIAVVSVQNDRSVCQVHSMQSQCLQCVFARIVKCTLFQVHGLQSAFQWLGCEHAK